MEHVGSAPGELGLLANLATMRSRTEAEVNATEGAAGGGMGLLRKSPMTKLVRLAKLAASSKARSVKCSGRSSKQLFLYQAEITENNPWVKGSVCIEFALPPCSPPLPSVVEVSK